MSVWPANSVWLQDVEAVGSWWSNKNAEKGLEENQAGKPVNTAEAASFGMVWSSGEAGWGVGWRTDKFLSGKTEKVVKGLRLYLQTSLLVKGNVAWCHESPAQG